MENNHIGDGRARRFVAALRTFEQDSDPAPMLGGEPMASPGAGCLALAWKHRGLILGL